MTHPPGELRRQALPPLRDDVCLVGKEGRAALPAQAGVQTLGFKAWNLLRMAELGLPVPPAFVIGTSYCAQPRRRADLGDALWRPGLAALEQATGRRFGDTRRPLLVSVRSGAPVSMPGMMDTVLDVGLCDATLGGLLRQTGNPRLVWDAYRRLVASYGEVVAGIPAQCFDDARTEFFGARDERELDFAELRRLAKRFLDVYGERAEGPFPQEPAAQLRGAVEAVFASWQSPRARAYRRLNGIDDAVGTAVTVQAMVFGNSGGRSGAGVGFTRDPASGRPGLWVDFLFDAQGEDLVSGRRAAGGHAELEAVLPSVWQQLVEAGPLLERELGDMQDFEFTVEDGRLFMLQTRSGKRTSLAAVRIALDLLDDGVIDATTALQRTAGYSRESLARRRIAGVGASAATPLARAVAAGHGVAVGEIALDEARVRARRAAGADVVLVRRDAETADIAALECAVGLLAQRGARTSHAAVVARQLDKVCLVGCEALRLDPDARTVSFGATTLREGDAITLDGDGGAVYPGALSVTMEYAEDLVAGLEALRRTAGAGR